MLDNENIISIENLLDNKKIIKSKLLSESFGINCFKILTSDKKNYIIKYYKNKNQKFNAIKSEADNLIFLNNLKLSFFPKVFSNSKEYLIMSFIENDGLKPNKTNKDFLNAIVSIHKFSDEKYGFHFDTQIGGLKQNNEKSSNWVKFYREHRLGYIYELINTDNPMERSINKKIEKLLKNLENFIPSQPKVSLLHGDLWEGNILFNKKSFKSFIDPGSFYGHNEMEVAYLRWFNPSFIDNNFLEKYNEYIILDKNYLDYEMVYQLYYSLCNVYLWDRSFIFNTKKLLERLKI